MNIKNNEFYSKLLEYTEKFKKALEAERRAEILNTLDEIKRLSGFEREKRGRAVLNLKGSFAGREIGGFYLVKFGRKKEIDTEISPGDEVLISRGEPLKSSLTGTVTELTSRSITIAFTEIPPNWVFDSNSIRIDLYVNDITFKRIDKTLDHLFYIKNQKTLRLLSIILGLMTPRKIEKAEIVDFYDKELNEFQKEAVRNAVGAENIFLIHGPPGTGKTRTVTEVILQEAARGNKVIATTESNTAADNILENLIKSGTDIEFVRLGHPARVSRELIESTLAYKLEQDNFYRKAQELREKAFALIEKRESFRKPTPQWRRGLDDKTILKLARKGRGIRGISPRNISSMANWIKINRQIQDLFEEIDYMEKLALKNILTRSMMIVSTNSSAGIDYMDDFEFDVAVIDEGSQATEPSCLIPIAKSRKLIISGDHRQLPPTIMSKEAAAILSKTLFERLISPDISSLLRVQYRMNEKIMEFPNQHFYDGLLIAHDSVREITLKDLNFKPTEPENTFLNEILNPENVLVFIDTSKSEENFESQRLDSTSRFNVLEAKIVSLIVKKFVENGLKEADIGVITPYNDQVDLIKKMLQLEEVQISSVDGFQGREKELIVLSLVRSNEENDIGFLEDVRRLNVSVTRAKRKLIIVANSKTISFNEFYLKLTDHFKQKGLFIDSTTIESLLGEFSKTTQST
jgi:predicted DNA helicase